MPTSSTHAQIVAHIQAVLASVTDLGNIITRPRDLQDLEDVKDVFGTEDDDGNPLINAWVISREGVRISRTGVPASHEYRIHTYVVRAYYSINDDLSTDDTFQGKINSVLDAFTERRQKASAGATPRIEDTDSINARVITVTGTVLAGHFVHYAEIELLLRERVTGIVYI